METPTSSNPRGDGAATGGAPVVPGASRPVLSVLPFLYIAWADGLLTPAQIAGIRSRVEAQDWIAPADKEALAKRLDPENPPSAAEYERWMEAIRRAARDLPPSARPSLADLGEEMARLAEASDEKGSTTPEAHRALTEMEEALGIVGHEAARELVHGRPSEASAAPGEAPFDAQAMKALLDAPFESLRDRVRSVLCEEAFRYVAPETSVADYRDQVFVWTKRLAEEGFGALSYPKQHGGAGDVGRFMAAFETLAFHDLSLVIKFGVQFGLFGGSIQQLGTERHHKKYLEPAGTLALPGCFAMSELGHGSNVRELETTATFDPDTDKFVIHTPREAARKEWIGNAARHGRVATVFAQLRTGGQDYGVHAFVVPIRGEDGAPAPGVRIEDCGHKMGLNGVDNGRLWFDHVRIPREDLLDRFASVDEDGRYHSPIPSAGKRFFTMLGTLVGGRISVAAAGLSAAKSGLTIAVRYGARRRQFGPKGEAETPILDYLSHQRRLFPSLAAAYGLDFAISDLVRRYAGHEDRDDLREIEGTAAALKSLSSWSTIHTLQQARECCGGQGYLTENRIPQLKRDTDIFATFEGDNTVLMLQVAKGLLSEFNQGFQDMNFFGMVRYLAGRQAAKLIEQSPLTGRNTDPAHLRDVAFQQAAFKYREQSLLQSAALRLKGRIDDGMDSYEAFIAVQDHLLALAHAHAERLVLEGFVEGAQRCDDEALKGPLQKLRSLYALSRLEEGSGWFQQQGRIEAPKAKAIRAQVNALCGEIRPMAVALVDAFAIPDELLAAPIALKGKAT